MKKAFMTISPNSMRIVLLSTLREMWSVSSFGTGDKKFAYEVFKNGISSGLIVVKQEKH